MSECDCCSDVGSIDSMESAGACNLEERRKRGRSTASFMSMITPVSSLIGSSTRKLGQTQFHMTRVKKIVILQWEGFSGSLVQNGIHTMNVVQNIPSTPNFSMSTPITVEYNGRFRMGYAQVTPGGTLSFHITGDTSSFGDGFTVHGGSISWMV